MDTAVLNHLNQGATAVTATKRLTREVQHQFNRHQLEQGERAWVSPDILTFEAWNHRLWQQIIQHQFSDSETANNTAIPVVLNNAQCKSLWQQIISDDIQLNQKRFEPLWNIPATVNSALNAWKVCCEWKIDPRQCRNSMISDHHNFSRWAWQYQQQCINNHWTDNYQLIDDIVKKIEERHFTSGTESRSTALVFSGFDIFTEQQSLLVKKIQSLSVDLTIHNSPTSTVEQVSSDKSLEFDNPYNQWLGAAHWAKKKLDTNPDQKIALVVPELNKSRDMIDYALSQTLCPGKLLGKNGNAPKPYHISLGKKLAEFPLVQAALLLLSMTGSKPIKYSTISKLLLNPFISGATSECHNRSKLEFWCRQNLPYQINLDAFLERLRQSASAPASPVIVELLTAAVDHQPSMQSQQSYSTSSQQILNWLNLFGWPGQVTLDSEEYQATEAFRREVSVLATLDLVSNRVRISSAISTLAQRLAEQPFEPESPPVNIEVLGVLESSGVEFDAIWFGDLNENQWPPTLQQNPFLPYWLQKQSNSPHTSSELNTQLAVDQQTRLKSQCDEFVLSRFRFDNEVILHPSPLFSSTGSSHNSQFHQSATLIEHYQCLQPELELFTDRQGLIYTEHAAPGGVTVIANQAACPFRAYAKHRLDGYDAEPRQPGLDAKDRGTLIHKILEQVWRKIESSKKLHALSTQALAAIIAQVVQQQSKYYFYSSGCSNEFFRVQNQWLNEMLLQWFELEKSRDQEFEVIGMEKKQQLLLEDLALNLKIDRIDRLGDNTLMLVDYKTGRTESVSGWIDERPQSPQLPLYALAQTQDHETSPDSPISALSFARVRSGEYAYVGISQDESFQVNNHSGLKIQPLDKIKIEEDLKDWQALFVHWQENMARLAGEFKSGCATVDPLPGACKNCGLHGLCRIAERDSG